MISLLFHVPEDFIAYYALTGTDKSFFRKEEFDSDVIALQKLSASLDKSSMELIHDDYIGLLFLEPEVKEHKLSTKFKKLDDMLQNLEANSIFKKILRETSETLTKIRHDWEESLAKMNPLADFLLDGKESAELKVFVSLPALNLSHVYFGDIFIANDDRTPYANTLNLWNLVSSILVKQGDANPSVQNSEANHRWLRDIILDLCNCEAKTRLSGKNSFEPSRADDKAYRRDFEFLSPKFNDYLKSEKKKQLSEFRDMAMSDLQKIWDAQMKPG